MEPGNWGVTKAGVVTASSRVAPDGPAPDGPAPDGPVPDGPVHDGPAHEAPADRAPLVNLDVRRRRFALRQAIVDLAAHEQGVDPDRGVAQRLSEAAATAAADLAAAGDDDGLRDVLRPDPGDGQVIWTVACYQIGDLTPTALRDFAEPSEAVVTLAGCGDASHIAAEMVASTVTGLRWTVLERAGSVGRLHLLSGDRGAGAPGGTSEILADARRRWADRLTIWGQETEPAAAFDAFTATIPSWPCGPSSEGGSWPATEALTAALAALAAGAGLPPEAAAWSADRLPAAPDGTGAASSRKIEEAAERLDRAATRMDEAATLAERRSRLDETAARLEHLARAQVTAAERLDAARAAASERAEAADARALEAERRVAAAEARLDDILAHHAAGLEETATDHIVELTDARAAAQVELGTVGEELARVASRLGRLDERIRRLEPKAAGPAPTGNLTISITLPRVLSRSDRRRAPAAPGTAAPSWRRRVHELVDLLTGARTPSTRSAPGPTGSRGATTTTAPIDVRVPPH